MAIISSAWNYNFSYELPNNKIVCNAILVYLLIYIIMLKSSRFDPLPNMFPNDQTPEISSWSFRKLFRTDFILFCMCPYIIKRLTSNHVHTRLANKCVNEYISSHIHTDTYTRTPYI